MSNSEVHSGISHQVKDTAENVKFVLAQLH